MDEQTKKEIYEIIEQSKVLEGLMKELECPLSEKQKNNLSAEEFFIDSTLCTAGCISDIVSRIDNALHHVGFQSEYVGGSICFNEIINLWIIQWK